MNLARTKHVLRLPRRPGNPAFTLVEVLTVIAVVAIVLPGVMYGLTLASGIANSAKQRAAAGAIATNKLTELVATNAWQQGDTQGEVADGLQVYHWKSQLQRWSDTGLEELTVEVSWQARGGQRAIALTTLVTDTETQ